MQAYFSASKPRTMSKRSYASFASSVPMGIPVGIPVRSTRARTSSRVYKGRTASMRSGSWRGFYRRSGYYRRFNRAVGTELKFFDTVKGLTATNSAGVLANSSLCLIPQGADESERVGRKCTVKSLHMHGRLKQIVATSGANTSNKVRIVVYVDKQTNGATANVGDLLSDPTDVNSFRNLVNSGRFKFLMDRTFDIYQTGAAPTGAAYEYGEITKTFNLNCNLSLPLEFDGATGALAELRTNNIGVAVFSSDSTITQFQYTARIRYADN